MFKSYFYKDTSHTTSFTCTEVVYIYHELSYKYKKCHIDLNLTSTIFSPVILTRWRAEAARQPEAG